MKTLGIFVAALFAGSAAFATFAIVAILVDSIGGR